MQAHNEVAQRSNGAVVSGATVTVYLAGTATLATLYSDNSSTALANPFTANTQGEYTFYAADGRYDVVVSYESVTDDAYEVILSDTPLNVRNFGALGDGTTDDTTAITNAINSLSKGGTVYFPQGDYVHSGLSFSDLRFINIIGDAPISFTSAGAKGTRFSCTSATADHMLFTDCWGIKIKDISFEAESTVTPTAGNGIKFIADGVAASAYCVIDGVRMENIYNGILLDGVSNSDIRNSTIRESIGTYSIKLAATNKRMDQIRLADIVIDTEVSGGSTTSNGVDISSNVHTVWVNRVSSLKCKYGFYLHGATDPEFIRFNGAEAEGNYSHGFLIDNADHIWLNNVYATTNNGNGIAFGATFNNVAILQGPDVRANDLNGILISGSGGIYITNPKMGQNSNGSAGTYHGIAIAANINNVSVIGGKIGGNVDLTGTGDQGYGILVNSGTSDYINIIGVDLSGNTTGGLSYGGTGTNKNVLANIPKRESYGTASSLTPDASGNDTIAHGLAGTPTFVSADILGDVTNAQAEVQAVDGTNITLRFASTTDGSDITTGTYNVMWEAKV